MGQNSSTPEKFIDETMDTLQFEVMKHARVLSEINNLSYEDFQKCIFELNELSRKCIDSSGKQLVFAVKKGTDTSFLWKATIRIACVKVDSNTRKIDSFKFLNLKQFLCVFKTFQSHIEALISSEDKMSQEHNASMIMNQVDLLTSRRSSTSSSDEGPSTPSATSPKKTLEHFTECSICLDRKPELLLPCAHTFCCPCIEQWNVNNKTCPICQEELTSTDDTWVLSEIPQVQEVSEEICSELMKLSKDAASKRAK